MDRSTSDKSMVHDRSDAHIHNRIDDDRGLLPDGAVIGRRRHDPTKGFKQGMSKPALLPLLALAALGAASAFVLPSSAPSSMPAAGTATAAAAAAASIMGSGGGGQRWKRLAPLRVVWSNPQETEGT